MSQKSRIYLKRFLLVCCIVLFAWLCYYNYTSNTSFWDASAVDCITILIAVIISYYFVQKQNDYQKQKDIVLDIILKTQALVEQKVMYDLSGQDKDAITMRTRDLNNRIHILETLKGDFNIAKDVEFVRKHFDEYNTLIGDHINSIDYLLQSQKELKRPIDLISQKLLETALHLYG